MKKNSQNRLRPLIHTAFLSMLLAACGGGGGGNTNTGNNNNGSPPPGGSAVMTVLAGDVYGAGNLDETGAVASFAYPQGVAVDASGNVYVADSSNHSIRKVSSAGVVTTLAGTRGTGSADGTGTSASFRMPHGVAVDSSGNVYVADTYNHTIRKVTSAGVVTTLAGTAGVSGSTDATGANASFNTPNSVAVDGSGNLYVADTSNHVIRKIVGNVVTTLAGTAGVSGSGDSSSGTVGFNAPEGVAVDSAGNVYVADTGNSIVRKITPGGVVSTIAGTAGQIGSLNANGAAARLSYPSGITVDSAGNVYVTESCCAVIRKIAPNADVTTLSGVDGQPGSVDGSGSTARFYFPAGIAVDSAGNLFVSDTLNNNLRKITPAAVVTTLAGRAGVQGSSDGNGTSASFKAPLGLAADSAGNLFVADHANHMIRKVTSAGVVTSLAGTVSSMGGHADGTGAAATFCYPYAVATDSAGNVYVADTFNHGIRKITQGGVTTTFAGVLGFSGSGDTGSGSVQFNTPMGIATDSAGNVYVADTGNHTIRKITAAGVVSTLAGTAGATGSTDATGAAASFWHPSSIAVDASGTVYVSDGWNYTIRKITAAGVVTTLAGTAGVSGSADGTGPAAQFGWLNAISVDGAGNVYAADSGNSTIRKVTPAGVVTTVIGTSGQAGFVADSLPGVVNRPAGLAIIGTTLYFTQHNGIVQVANLP